jgi:hypothetical protein
MIINAGARLADADGTYAIGLLRPLAVAGSPPVTHLRLRPISAEQIERWADGDFESSFGLLAEMAELPEKTLAQLGGTDLLHVMEGFTRLMTPSRGVEAGRFPLVSGYRKPVTVIEEPKRKRSQQAAAAAAAVRCCPRCRSRCRLASRVLHSDAAHASAAAEPEGLALSGHQQHASDESGRVVGTAAAGDGTRSVSDVGDYKARVSAEALTRRHSCVLPSVTSIIKGQQQTIQSDQQPVCHCQQACGGAQQGCRQGFEARQQGVVRAGAWRGCRFHDRTSASA